MNKIFALLCFFFLIGMKTFAQSPSPALVGYWQNWSDPAAPYFPLSEVDSRYNMVDIAFAVPETGTDYQMKFVPDRGTQAEFIQQIQTLQALGTKVNISIGGANSPVSLDNDSERDAFISSMGNIINTYGFDGFDIDLEGSSLAVHGGTINNPVDVPVINLIYAIKQIMADDSDLILERMQQMLRINPLIHPRITVSWQSVTAPIISFPKLMISKKFLP